MADFSLLAQNTDGSFIEISPTSGHRAVTGRLLVSTSLVSPSGNAFPGSPSDGGIFWRTDEQKLYRYNSTVPGWEAVIADTDGTLEAIGAITEEPHGFPNWIDSTISFNPGTLTFTLAPTGASFDYFYHGRRVTKTGAQNKVIPNTDGTWYLYYDGSDTLQASLVKWDFILHVPVAIIHWNTTTVEGELAEERHGIVMDSITHKYLHTTVGTRYRSGLVISGYTLDTATDAAVTFGLTNGIIVDEDIEFNITHAAVPSNPFEQFLNDPAKIPVWYRAGANGYWQKDAPTDFAFKNTAAGRVNYNQYTGGAWQQTETTNGRLCAVWLFGTNNVLNPIISIQGQREDTTLALARSNNTLEALDLGTLPFEEMKVLYRIIIATSNGFGGTRKAEIKDVTDLRALLNIPAGTFVPASHASLADLNTSGHPANVITTDTTNFDKVLSATDTEVQTALDTIDESRDVAQWNANRLQTRNVAATAPVDKQYLGWNAGATQWEPKYVGDNLYHNASTGESSTTSETYQQKLRLTFTPVAAGDYLISFTCLVSSEDSNELILTRVQVDDTTTHLETILELGGSTVYSDGTYAIRSGSFVVSLTAAAHNIDLDYATSNSAEAAYIKEATLVAQRVS